VQEEVAENANQQWPGFQLSEELNLIETEICECDQCSRLKSPMALTGFAMSCNLGLSSLIPNNLISREVMLKLLLYGDHGQCSAFFALSRF
jgi:hypothetical protein